MLTSSCPVVFRSAFRFVLAGVFALGLSVSPAWASADGSTAEAVADSAAELDASRGADLARSKACLACHQEEARRVGPPYREIAARYANSPDQAGALNYLADAIRNGGRGRWGAIPMPAQPHVTVQEARILAAWILSLAPDL